MSHEVKSSDDHLEFLHGKIMQAIHEVISHKSPFIHKENSRALGLDCLNVAAEVYTILSSYMSIASLDDMIKGKKRDFETFGAFPMMDRKLALMVEKIYAQFLQHIDTLPPALLARIVKTSDNMDNNNKNNIFSITDQYPPFQNKSGALQPVSTGDKKSGEKLFRAHLCKLQMRAGNQVHDELQEAVSNCYFSLVHADDEIEDKESALVEINRQINKLFYENDNPALIGLRNLLDNETSGLVRREIGIVYLEYLLENANSQSISAAALERILTNIRWIESYIHDPNRSNRDCLYQVTDEHSCDLRELLGNADAFTSLPVIGLVDGHLEERSSDNQRVFVFGIRFKANNPVMAPDRDFSELKSGSSVYRRHLEKAIKVLELAKQFNTAQGDGTVDYKPLRLIGRSIKTVFLYYLVFSGRSDKLDNWQQIAQRLHARDADGLDQLLALANTMLNAEPTIIAKHIAPAVAALKQVLSEKKACSQTRLKRCILLEKELLNDDLFEASEGNIFIKDLYKSARQDMNPLKKCLRYVRIVEEQSVPSDALYSIDFELSFQDTFFYADRTEKRAITVHTPAQAWHFLPVLVQPNKITRPNPSDIFHNPLLKTAGLVVQLMPNIEPDKSNSFEFFVYQVTAAVVFLLGLSALCQKLSVGRQLAIPLLRLHKADESDPLEKYLKAVVAAVTFLLNEKYTAGMQGIQLIDFKGAQNNLGYRVTNARSSLYAFLPKIFTAASVAPAFDKLAIVIVTQRVASKQRHQDDNDSLVNLFGRVVMLERLDDNTIQLSPNFLTFADNLYKQEIHSQPKLLIDIVHELYDRYGVRDILYIAKAPFTSNLNLTQKNSQQELYFLSELVLQQMRQNRADLNIYPAFCDKYPARMFSGANLNAVYIDDVPSIQKHVQMDRDKESQIVTFLNIANGLKVKGKEAEKNFFNNVMCYATLDNIYTDRTLQSRILERLISPDDNAPRKTLIDFICLLHAAAYEKFDKNELTQLTLKLNPYQDILEDNNVNQLNTFSAFPNGKPDFNLFAFMTKIQRILYRLSQ